MRRKGTRGQIALFGIMALAVVVIFVLYTMFSRGKTESEVRRQEIQSETVRNELESVQSSLERFLEAAVHESAEEMAAHGGYTKENHPPLSHLGVPYWFYEGKIVNIPTSQVMEQMMVQEIERNVKERVLELQKTLRRDLYSFGFPKANVTLLDNSITARLSLPVRIRAEGEEVKTDIEFDVNVPLRLKFLHDIAVYYVESYIDARTMEDSIFDSITSDPRIPKPGGDCCKGIPSCDQDARYEISVISTDGNPLSKHGNLIEPFREHSRLAVANEMRRVRKADFSGVETFTGMEQADIEKVMEFVEWTFDLYENEFKFSFIANEDKPDYRSTDTVYFFRLGPFGLSPSGDCTGGYKMNYSIHFPVKIILRDLLPSAKVVGAAGTSSEIKPLEFKFYMEPYLQKLSAATNESVSAPKYIEDQCQGACSLTVDLDPPAMEGSLRIDSCRYPSNDVDMSYSSGTTWDGVPCGVHDIVFEAEGTEYARSSLKEKIGAASQVTLPVRKFGALSSRVVMRNDVYCASSQTVEEREPVPLGYVDGRPPAYVEVFLFPMDTTLGDVVSAITDEDGGIEFPTVNPGKYLLLAVSSKDSSDRPIYPVLPKGMILEVVEGTSSLPDIAMKPITVELDREGTYHNVVSRDEDC
ncbi:MAG: carboxypeptidase-like regulatory domain-containing protein [Candidatus Undinarchaeales archaeon]|nr:carboxypeptidase-like regulatory domain-containing protein [Candidatus Undinarchaeales archaeon]